MAIEKFCLEKVFQFSQSLTRSSLGKADLAASSRHRFSSVDFGKDFQLSQSNSHDGGYIDPAEQAIWNYQFRICIAAALLFSADDLAATNQDSFHDHWPCCRRSALPYCFAGGVAFGDDALEPQDPVELSYTRDICRNDSG